MAEKFGKRLNTLIRPPRPAGSPCGLRLRLRPSAFFNRQDVEAPLPIHQPGGGEHVEVGMEVEVVPESLHGGDGGELSIRQLESRPHPISEAFDGCAEEMIEELAALAEDPAEGFRHRKHELAMRHLEAEDSGDPVAGLADFALMAARAEVARLAGEGEEALVAAVGALEPRESGSEVAAAMELADDGYGVLAQRAVDGTVTFFITGLEIGPAMVHNLPQGRSTGTARAIDGWHDNCSLEQLSCVGRH